MPIGHIFILMLENQNASVTFGAQTPVPYLAQTLPAQGAMLPNYYGIGHASLDNYIALISGQAPNVKTQLDCPLFAEFVPVQQGLDAHGQALGQGFVYPNMVKSLPDQLEAKGLTWKGYMEDMGKDPARERATCGHPAVGTEDHTLIAWQIKQGILSPDEARTSPHKNVITRAVGNRDYVQVDTSIVRVEPGDRYLLCSDGLHGYLHQEEIADLVDIGGDNAVRAFIDLANLRGGRDNITAVLLEVD